jgi:tetratricopeptide (TPR) repeat protein
MRKVLRNVLLTAWVTQLAFAQQQDTPTLSSSVDREAAEGHPEEAQKALAELLARPYIKLDVLLESGAKLAQGEHFEQARAVFARGVKDYPKNFEVHYNLALADIALRRLDEAHTTLEAQMELSKDQSLAREYLRGKIYDATGEQVLAERCLTAALTGAPQQENYALDLGMFYLRQRNHAKALKILEAAIKYHPQSIYLLLSLALIEYLDNNPADSAATCFKILALEPLFGPAHVLLAVSYYTNGEYAKCLKETESSIGRPETPPYLYYLHAASLLNMESEDYAAMLGDLKTAIQTMPGCAFCYFALSKVHQAMGNAGGAIGDLQTLVERIDPEFSKGWYRLASLYQHSGRTADAARALEKFHAIKTAQTDPEAAYLRKFFLSELGDEGSERK